MKKAFVFLFLLSLVLPFAASDGIAQEKTIRKTVIGAGGMVGAVSGNIKMSGIVGQVAIEKKTIETQEGKEVYVHQGFWTPTVMPTGITTDPISLNQKVTNFPNPLSSHTTFNFALEAEAQVQIAVYDMVGNRVANVYEGIKGSGEQQVSWSAVGDNGVELSSGSYVYEVSVRPVTGDNSGQSFTLRNVLVVVK